MDFSNIVTHPDSEEIISKLVTGTSPKEISQWLKLKYSEKHLQLSIKVLEDYKNSHVDLMETLRKDVALIKASGQDPALEKQISRSLLNNKTYRERLVELADNEVNINKKLEQIIFIIEQRSEQIFDKLQESPSSFKGDYALIKWLELLTNNLERLHKIKNNAPDQVIQHNITVQMVDNYKAVFQEAIRKTLAQMDTESSLMFIELLGTEMLKLNMPQNISLIPTIQSREKDAQILADLETALNNPELK